MTGGCVMCTSRLRESAILIFVCSSGAIPMVQLWWYPAICLSPCSFAISAACCSPPQHSGARRPQSRGTPPGHQDLGSLVRAMYRLCMDRELLKAMRLVLRAAGEVCSIVLLTWCASLIASSSSQEAAGCGRTVSALLVRLAVPPCRQDLRCKLTCCCLALFSRMLI